jgi:1,2-phenylacetyl-CoA epoxidase PaaB subunit
LHPFVHAAIDCKKDKAQVTVIYRVIVLQKSNCLYRNLHSSVHVAMDRRKYLSTAENHFTRNRLTKLQLFKQKSAPIRSCDDGLQEVFEHSTGLAHYRVIFCAMIPAAIIRLYGD